MKVKGLVQDAFATLNHMASTSVDTDNYVHLFQCFLMARPYN